MLHETHQAVAGAVSSARCAAADYPLIPIVSFVAVDQHDFVHSYSGNAPNDHYGPYFVQLRASQCGWSQYHATWVVHRYGCASVANNYQRDADADCDLCGN